MFRGKKIFRKILVEVVMVVVIITSNFMIRLVSINENFIYRHIVPG